MNAVLTNRSRHYSFCTWDMSILLVLLYMQTMQTTKKISRNKHTKLQQIPSEWVLVGVVITARGRGERVGKMVVAEQQQQ